MTLEDQVKGKPMAMGPEDTACISLRNKASEPVPGLAPLLLRVMRLNFTEKSNFHSLLAFLLLTS